MADYPAADVVDRIEALDEIGWPWISSLAVIASWGPSHASLFHALADRGVRHVLCEKPMAASVAQAYEMTNRAEREGIALAVNHCLRYQGIVPALHRFFDENDLGKPIAVVVDGGAAGLVTNGIHWLDFAIELFEHDPESVLGTVFPQAINPRSPDLMFYGGSAAWRFGKGREATISFSNRSSIEPTAHVYLREAVAELTHDISDGNIFVNTTIRRCDPDTAEHCPTATQLAPVDQIVFSGKLPGARLFVDALDAAIVDLQFNEGRIVSGFTGAIALSAIIGALLSSREGKSIALPINPTSQWGREFWPIS